MTIETMGYFLSAIKSNQELFNNEYPVIMTTMSTLLGAIPLMLSSGAGAESRFAMSVVVFGGIALASFITLYLIPALYMLIERDN